MDMRDGERYMNWVWFVRVVECVLLAAVVTLISVLIQSVNDQTRAQDGTTTVACARFAADHPELPIPQGCAS